MSRNHGSRRLIDMDGYTAALWTLIVSSSGFVSDALKVSLVDSFTGTDTLMERPAVQLVTSDGGWDTVWRMHKGATLIANGAPASTRTTDIINPPAVNFKKFMVVAIFGGQTKNIGGYAFDGATNNIKTIELYFHPATLPGRVQVITNPYGFFMFPKSKRTVRVKLQTGVDRTGQPIYQTIGDYPGS